MGVSTSRSLGCGRPILVERTAAIHSPSGLKPSLLVTMTYTNPCGNERALVGSRFPAKAGRGNCFAVALGVGERCAANRGRARLRLPWRHPRARAGEYVTVFPRRLDRPFVDRTRRNLHRSKSRA